MATGNTLSETTYTISNEDNLWAAIQDIVEKPKLDGIQLQIKGWDDQTIIVRGLQYNGTVSYTAMQYFCDLQNRIYTTFALAKHGVSDVRKLTNEERFALEIFVKVENGSSKYEEYFWKCVAEFTKGLAQKVTRRDAVLIILAVIATFGGNSFYKTWLEQQRQEKELALQQKRDDNDAKLKLGLLETIKFGKEKDWERYKILADLAGKNPDIAKVKQEAEEHYKERLKFASKTDAVISDNLEMKGEVAEELLRVHRPDPIPVRLDGIYKIEQTNHKPSDFHTFTITNTENGQHITSAKLTDLLAASEIGTAILAAAMHKHPLGLKVNGSMVRGEIVHAEIVGLYGPENKITSKNP